MLGDLINSQYFQISEYILKRTNMHTLSFAESAYLIIMFV